MGELRRYGKREQIRTGHLREAVAGYAGWRSMDTAEWKDLDEFLFAHDHPACRDCVAHASGAPEPFDLTKLA